jgi:hypothetical protein
MWKNWSQKPIDTTRQLQAWIQGAAHSGKATARSMLGSMPFCASLISSSKPQAGPIDEDLIHYFLIPSGINSSGYTLFSKHQLPVGVGTANDLPKITVFHLPNSGAEDQLEELVLHDLSADISSLRVSDEESLDQRLGRVAKEIEKNSNFVTMGILIVGGAVAIANPLVGVSIAAQAVFPSLGGVVSAEAMKLGGGKLRGWRERSDAKKSAKQAKVELKQRKVRVVINPFLAKLQRAINTDELMFDPSMEDPFLQEAEDFPQGLRSVTLEVLAEYYLEVQAVSGDSQLGPEDRRWLNMLYQYAQSNPG